MDGKYHFFFRMANYNVAYALWTISEYMIYGHRHEIDFTWTQNHYFTNFDLNKDMTVPMIEDGRENSFQCSLCFNKSKTNKLVYKPICSKFPNQMRDWRSKHFAEHKMNFFCWKKMSHKDPEEFVFCLFFFSLCTIDKMNRRCSILHHLQIEAVHRNHCWYQLHIFSIKITYFSVHHVRVLVCCICNQSFVVE